MHYRKKSRNPFWAKERERQERNRKVEQKSLDANVSSSLRVKIWVRIEMPGFVWGQKNKGP